MKEVKLMQELWVINEELFKPKLSSWASDDMKLKMEYVRYQDVIPVYVYSLNDLWDGSKTFDVCPIKLDKKSNTSKQWRWRRSVGYKEINEKIWLTKEAALKHFNAKYSEEELVLFREKKQLRGLL